jgi:hypothetical protein
MEAMLHMKKIDIGDLERASRPRWVLELVYN